MKTVGKVDSLWRYPVKSMRGEALDEAFVGFAGVYGDRLFAFRSAARPAGFPYLTGRDVQDMLLYRPRFRSPDRAKQPINLADAEATGPGITPLYGNADDLAVEVETPSGELLGIDEPALIRMLSNGMRKDEGLTLIRSERAMTDCRPVSLISLQTVEQLGEELGIDLDKRRFRANVYLDLDGAAGFAEDAFVGKTLKIGSKVAVSVLERDPRCKMITLDPETAEANPAVLRKVARGHGNMAGLYGAVLVEGMVKPGDEVTLSA